MTIMLRKILDYEFNIGGRPIDRSGQNNHGLSTATIFSTGPGNVKAAAFLAKNARIVVPHRPCWNHIGAARVDVSFSLDELKHRTTLVEIEGSLALFIRADGVPTFTFYAPVDQDDEPEPNSDIDFLTIAPTPIGSVDPFDTLTANIDPDAPTFTWHGVNTDADFSPDGIKRTVPLQEYVTVSAIHDGVATMRIYLNGELAGFRSDIRYSVLPLISPRIVSIGAWPYDDRYTLKGRIDSIRIWRQDPEFAYRQFFCRPMSEEARRCWHKLFRDLADRFESEETTASVRHLLHCVARMQRDLYRAVAANGEPALRRLREFSEEYLDLWCSGRIDGNAMFDHMERFLKWLEQQDTDLFARTLSEVLTCLIEVRGADLCRLAEPLAECDPAWMGFISHVGRAIPNPLCGSGPTSPPDDSGYDGGTDDTCASDDTKAGDGNHTDSYERKGDY